jgi:hypothetical protein
MIGVPVVVIISISHAFDLHGVINRSTNFFVLDKICIYTNRRTRWLFNVYCRYFSETEGGVRNVVTQTPNKNCVTFSEPYGVVHSL